MFRCGDDLNFRARNALKKIALGHNRPPLIKKDIDRVPHAHPTQNVQAFFEVVVDERIWQLLTGVIAQHADKQKGEANHEGFETVNQGFFEVEVLRAGKVREVLLNRPGHLAFGVGDACALREVNIDMHVFRGGDFLKRLRNIAHDVFIQVAPAQGRGVALVKKLRPRLKLKLQDHGFIPRFITFEKQVVPKLEEFHVVHPSAKKGLRALNSLPYYT